MAGCMEEVNLRRLSICMKELDPRCLADANTVMARHACIPSCQAEEESDKVKPAPSQHLCH